VLRTTEFNLSMRLKYTLEARDGTTIAPSR
jgi:hypothetical protein